MPVEIEIRRVALIDAMKVAQIGARDFPTEGWYSPNSSDKKMALDLNRRAAVDVDDLACDETGFSRNQKQNQICHIYWVSRTIDHLH